MNKISGVVKVPILGKVRGFHFSTNAWYHFCRNYPSPGGVGIELNEMTAIMVGLGKSEMDDFDFYRRLLYSAAVNYCELNNLEIDFDLPKIGLWIDEMADEDMKKVIETIMDSKFMATQLFKAAVEKKKATRMKKRK